MSAFDVGETVAGVAELYAPLAEEKGVALKVAAASGLAIVGNRELIGQAVANLIDNAVKYGVAEAAAAEAPASPTEIAVSARGDGQTVTIEVADRGPGIPAADRARAVERFVRLEGARSRPGSGLGLSLAAAVARMHGGAVKLEDNAPGLKVAVTLPAVAAAPAKAPAPPPVEAAA
jgi:signal transduction histidine kinase